MHFEYSYIIERALRTLATEGSRRGELIRKALTEVLPIKTENCPPAFTGEISTNVAFPLARCLAAMGADGANTAPTEVARWIEEAVLADKEFAKCFELSLGELGHINATPTDYFREMFLEKLFLHGTDLLFLNSSFVFERLGERQGRMNIDWDWLLDAENWPANGQEDDLRRICSQENKLGDDDALMFLALLADPELELTPYLESLSGTQNIPWFLQKFLRDGEMFSSRCLSGKSYDSRDLLATSIHNIPSYCNKSLRLLFLFRHLVIQRSDRRRGPQWVIFLVRVAKSFYFYYNRPQCRELAITDSDPQARRQVGAVTRILHTLVSQSLERIKRTC